MGTVTRRMAFVVILLVAGCESWTIRGNCACAADGNATGASSWAVEMPFDPIQRFDSLRIPNGPEPVGRELKFSAVIKKPDTRVVLRFRARLEASSPSGWNYYLGLSLNGQAVHGYSAQGTARLLNRSPEVSLDEGRVHCWPWWNRIHGGDVALLTFFGPGDDVLDPRVKSDRQEVHWYVVDIDDLVHFRVMGLDDRVVSDQPNVLRLTNGVLFRYVNDSSFPAAIEDLAVGYLPTSAWQQRVNRFLSPIKQLERPVTLQGAGFQLEIGPSGGMHVVRGNQVFGIESRFSYPGKKLGWNVLGDEGDQHKSTGWRAGVKTDGTQRATISAACPSYTLERSIVIDGPRIRVRDRVRNASPEVIGVMLQHSIATPKPFRQSLVFGVPVLSKETIAENPTVFLQGDSANLGFLAEDNLLRLQMNVVVQPNRALVKAEHVGLDVGGEYTFEWTLYPFGPTEDYWTLINRVRADWGVQCKITGPWSFFNVQRNAAILKDPAALRAYLERKNIKIVALVPWVDYENYDEDTGGIVTRQKLCRLLREAAAAFRAVDPTIKVTGCMESFPISLSLEDSRRLRDRLPPDQRVAGYPPHITRSMLEGLAGVTERDKDSLLVTPEGRVSAELYYRGGRIPGQDKVPMMALIAYPTPGNAQHDRLLEQAHFLKEQCGLDGIYIDCFTLAYDGNYAHMRYNYAKWDGHTVDLDADTGRITRKYTDAGYAGAQSRADLIKYVLQGDGVFVANSYPVCREEQALPAFRFSESEYNFDPLELKTGQRPLLFDRMCGSQLSTPIGLGYRPERLETRGTDQYARVMMKTVATYLRFGALTYHYVTEIPETGPGAGEYGPLNHMYPITPVELREGAVIGKERIVTAVSGRFVWPQERKPKVLVFDMTGRSDQAPTVVEQKNGRWEVKLDLHDWEQIGVIE
jgi:hypothetical protein